MKLRKKAKQVLVCVTDQFSCERLIIKGREIADAHGIGLQVLSIQPKAAALTACGEALEHLFQIAKEQDAGMAVYYRDDAELEAKNYILRNSVDTVVVGIPPDMEQSRFIAAIINSCPGLCIDIVDKLGVVHQLEVPQLSAVGVG